MTLTPQGNNLHKLITISGVIVLIFFSIYPAFESQTLRSDTFDVLKAQDKIKKAQFEINEKLKNAFTSNDKSNAFQKEADDAFQNRNKEKYEAAESQLVSMRKTAIALKMNLIEQAKTLGDERDLYLQRAGFDLDNIALYECLMATGIVLSLAMIIFGIGPFFFPWQERMRKN